MDSKNQSKTRKLKNKKILKVESESKWKKQRKKRVGILDYHGGSNLVIDSINKDYYLVDYFYDFPSFCLLKWGSTFDVLK